MTDWPVKTLGEVCDFVRGVTYDKADARSETKSGFIPLLRATNITERGLLREDFVFIPSDGVRADQKLVSGDALITIASGSASVVGRSVLVEDPGEMTFGAFCGVLRPGPKILPRYLAHFMSSRSVRTAWSEAAQGTNINNLKRDDILQTECLLPPLDEQKRIVALLDAATERVTELTACYEQARTHANNLFTSALRSAIAGNAKWISGALDDHCEVEYGTRVTRKRDGGTKYPVYGGGGATFNLDDFNRQDQMIVSRFAMSEECVRFVPGKFFLNDSGLTVRTRDELKMSQVFLDQQLLARSSEIYATARGTAQKNMDMTMFRSMEIAYPDSLKEQERLIEELEKVRAKTSEMVVAYDAKLIAAKSLRQSILEAAFGGDL